MSQIYTALGLMSGTSLDGVDAAFIETDGERIFAFGPTLEIPFADRSVIEEAIQAALAWQFQGPAPNILSRAESFIDRAHERAISRICAANPDWARRLSVIGYHGLTVLHHPPCKEAIGQTLQLGSGDYLARQFNVPVVYDFRNADVAAGGQGAPLAPIYHEALSEMSYLSGRVAIVNIGGVSNATFIDGGQPLLATDCGPGNGPLDSWVQMKTSQTHDGDGKLALSGAVDHALIDRWFRRKFFKKPMPRSADRYDFDLLNSLKGMSLEDGAATLASFTAQAIAKDLKDFDPETVILCGGGRHNPAIAAMLDMHCRGKVQKAENFGWDGDALEAQAFAYLAARRLRNLPISFPGTTGCPQPMTGGVIVRPN